MDVFEVRASALWDRENVVVTPHNSFVGEGNPQRLVAVIVENLNVIYWRIYYGSTKSSVSKAKTVKV